MFVVKRVWILLGSMQFIVRSFSGFKYIHDFVMDVLFDIFRRAGVSVKNRRLWTSSLTHQIEDWHLGRPTNVMVYKWVEGKHACVDLTGVSPLVWFVVGHATLKATSSKVTNMRKRVLTINLLLFNFYLTPFPF